MLEIESYRSGGGGMLEMAIFFPDDVSTWNFPTSTSYIYSPLPAIALGHDVRPFPSSFFPILWGDGRGRRRRRGREKVFRFPSPPLQGDEERTSGRRRLDGRRRAYQGQPS